MNALTRVVLTTAALAGSLTAVPAARANPELYQRTVRSTVWVVSPKDKGVSFGTGVFLDAERKLVLTNYHVVQERRKAFVFFAAFQKDQVVTDPNYYVKNGDRLAVNGQVLVRDVRRDLAVIQLQAVPAGVEPLLLAAASPRPAETVHAIGNSGVEGNSDGTLGGTLWRYSRGEVRQVYRRKLKSKSEGEAAREIEARMVETQVPSNPGDSGGPVVNDRGELVAITQSGDLEKQRLVTYGVDVTEVRAVLARAGNPVAAAPSRKADPAAPPLNGAWASRRPSADGGVERLRMEFRPDGQFVFVTMNAAGEVTKTTQGQYTFADGGLTLSVGGDKPKHGAVRFTGDDEFVLKGTGRATTWSRVRQ